MSQMNEIQAFVTSLFEITFDDVEFDKIEEHILDNKAKNNISSSRSNCGGWQSPFFQSYDSPIIQNLFEHKISLNAFGLIGYHIKHSVNLNTVEYWYNINTPNSYNMPHVHPNCLMSGVFYIKVPENSGNIVFTRPEIESLELSHINNGHNVTNPYTNTAYSIKPEQGKLILFPSYLSHYVEQNKSEEDRISISFNFRA